MSDPQVLASSDPFFTGTPAPFGCTRSPGRRGAVWFHLTGEFDLSVAQAVADQLHEARSTSYLVVVDLRDLELIDCAGLGVLVAADREARLAGRNLVVVRGSGQVDRMLRMTGLLGWLEVLDLDARSPTGQMRSRVTDPAVPSDTFEKGIHTDRRGYSLTSRPPSSRRSEGLEPLVAKLLSQNRLPGGER